MQHLGTVCHMHANGWMEMHSNEREKHRHLWAKAEFKMLNWNIHSLRNLQKNSTWQCWVGFRSTLGPHRGHGGKNSTLEKTDNTDGDGGKLVWTSKTKKQTHFTTASLLTPKQNKTNHIYLAQDSRSYSQTQKYKNQRETSVYLSDIKNFTSLPHRTEDLSNTQSRHTPVETQVCTNSFWMTWSTHITALCVVRITHGGHIAVNVSR